MMRRARQAGLVLAVTAWALAAPALSQPAGPESLPEGEAGPGELEADRPAGQLPGVTVDREAGHLDITARIANREADWLELLVTGTGHRTHETILATDARPSHVHLGLLLLGLEPGRPLKRERKGDQWQVHPPQGPAVEVWLLYEPPEVEADGDQSSDEPGGEIMEDGRRRVPAHQWVRNVEKERALAGNRWLFTGSRRVTFEGERFYLADRNGTVISLVSFGDDLLARDTTTTNMTDAQQLQAVTDRIPPEDTPVTVRLKPVAEEQAESAEREP